MRRRARRLLPVPLILLLAACAGQTAAIQPTPVPTVAALPAVSALGDAHVFVSDIATGDVAELGVGAWHLSRSVHGLGLSPDGAWLYVTDVATSRLFAFRLTTTGLGETHAVTVGSQPVHVAASRDGSRLFVTNFGERSLSVIDTAHWKVIKSIPTAASPHSIIPSPDGKTLYVGCYAGAAITVVDVASETATRTIALPPNTEPFGLALDVTGRYLYASDNLTGRLIIVDATKDAAVGAIAVGQRPALIARAPDGQTLYVSAGASHAVAVVSIADPLHPVVRAMIAVQGYPHGIAVTPDGRRLIVAGTSANTLTVIDTASLTVLATVPGQRDPNDVLVAR
jgi:YVTN family beta-propeller protein